MTKFPQTHEVGRRRRQHAFRRWMLHREAGDQLGNGRARIDPVRRREHLRSRVGEGPLPDRKVRREWQIDAFFVDEPRAIGGGPDRVRAPRVTHGARFQPRRIAAHSARRRLGRPREGGPVARRAGRAHRLRHVVREEVDRPSRVDVGDLRGRRIDRRQVRLGLREQSRNLILPCDHGAQPYRRRRERSLDERIDATARRADVAVGIVAPQLQPAVDQQLVVQRVLEQRAVEAVVRREGARIEPAQVDQKLPVAREQLAVVSAARGVESRVVRVEAGRRCERRFEGEQTVPIAVRDRSECGVLRGRGGPRRRERRRRRGRLRGSRDRREREDRQQGEPAAET